MFRLLFVCTHNRCRSILCEAIFRARGGERLAVHSAGSQPEGQVHPLSLRYLEEAGIETDGLSSKSWDDMGDFEPDMVLTVCDSAAGEACPLWLGSSLKLHWGLADPSSVEGDDAAKAEAFRDTIGEIIERCDALLTLPLETLDRDGLREGLTALGAA